MDLKGKRIACFLGLPHHTRFFIPLREEIEKRGGEIFFVVTLSEFPFEMDLMKRGMPFKFISDYMTEEIKEKIDVSLRELLRAWSKICSKWDGFSRWTIMKQSWYLEAIIPEYFCLERFFAVEKPDMFLMHHECNRWGQTIGYLARQQSVPFITFQEGDYYSDYIGLVLHTHYSTVDLLWGDMTRDFLSRYKCSGDKIIKIGNTHIAQAIQEYSDPDVVSETRKDLGLPLDRKVILFLLDIKYGGIEDRETWKRILQEIRPLKEKATCVFKWHPNVYKHVYDGISEIFKEFFPEAVLLLNYNAYKLIALSDCCVTLGKTTLAIEALAFGKPLFTLPAVDTMEEYYVDMGIAQTVYPLGDWSNLFRTMEEGVPAEIRANVETYLTRYFYRLDGKPVERAIDVMKYIFEVREERKKERVLPGGVEGRFSFVIPAGDENEREALLATLTSLSQNVTFPDWEVVIVVHDGETQDLLSGISGDLTVVRAEKAGLAALYNRGAEEASGEFFIFLRPGIVYYSVPELGDALRDGLAGIPLRNPDMTPYCLGLAFDFNFTPYKNIGDSVLPDAVGGGFISMSRKTYLFLGGFDEGVADHLAEPDLCLEAKARAVPVRYLKDALSINYQETFSRRDPADEDWRSRARFFAKWTGALPGGGDFLRFAGDLLKI